MAVVQQPFIHDANGVTWGLTATVGQGLQITRNGVVDANTANVTLLVYWNHVVYQQNNAGGWWSWNGSAWVDSADPRSVVTPPPPSSPTQFSISATPVAMPSGSAINVNLTSPVGATVTKSLYGVSMSTNNSTFNATFGDASWVGTMASLGMQHVRLHFEGVLSTIFSSPTAAPDWSCLAPFVANFNTVFPTATVELTIGWLDQYWPNDGSGNFTVNWTGTQLSQIASQCNQLLTYLKSHGVKVNYINVFNEPDGQGTLQSSGTTASSAVVAQVQTAIYNSLSTVDSSYQFGTAPTADGVVIGDYVSSMISAYPETSFISGHWYYGGSDPGIQTDLEYGGNTGYSPLQEVSSNTTVYNGRNYPVHMNEWSIEYTAPNPSDATFNMIGSIQAANITANGALTGLLYETATWDGAQPQYGWGNTSSTLAPLCFMLARAGQTMPGNIVNSNTTLTKFTAAAMASGGTAGPYITVLPTTGGVMVINSGTSNGYTNQTIALGGLLSSSVTRWQQAATNSSGGFSNAAGTLSSVTATNGVISGQSFPPLSVTIYYPAAA